MKRIFMDEVNGKTVLCFDTGLDSLSFAPELAKRVGEQGYIVYPDGITQIWKATGVCEIGKTMVFWGEPFSGERLDLPDGRNDTATPEKNVGESPASVCGESGDCACGELCAIDFLERAKNTLTKKGIEIKKPAIFFSRHGPESGGTHEAGAVFFAPSYSLLCV
jgi:hypothetical protein